MERFESELSMFEERDLMLEQKVKVYPEGIGVVEPTGFVSDAEVIEEAEATQAPIEDEHVVCIDERWAIESQPVRSKMAGGNVTTGFAAAELADWSLYTDAEREAAPEERVDAVAAYLVEAGEKLGGHVDNHATEEKSNCGAADGYPAVIEIIGAHGHDEEFTAQMKDVLGTHFDQEVWGQVISRAVERSAREELKSWNGHFVINAVKKHDGVVEELSGDNQNPKLDPTNARHNHWAEAVKINTEPGVSNDRDKARIPYFQVDVPKIVETCQKMAKDEAEFSRLLHAAAAYQFGVRYKLTKNQRNI